MKKLAKVLSLALVLVMVLSLGGTAWADPTAQTNLTVSVKSQFQTRNYSAYQIFKGSIDSNADSDYSNANTRTLSNIEWADGVTGSTIITALGGIAGFNSAIPTALGDEKTISDVTSANDVATVLTKITDVNTLNAIAKVFYANKPATPAASSSGTGESLDGTPVMYKHDITGLAAGYYIIVDATNVEGQENSAASAIMLNVVGNTSITEKVVIPSVKKEVQDETADKDPAADTSGWGKTADHNIGESFKFKLTATIPMDDNYAAYATYLTKFVDTPSSGITFESIDSVTIDGKNSAGENAAQVSVPAYDATTATNGYKLTNNLTGNNGNGTNTLNIEITDLKTTATNIDLSKGDVTITVIYNAHLNSNAYVTPVGGNTTTNFNKVKLEYSNNPNGSGTGETPEDTVWVFTYTVENTKWAGAGEKVETPASVTITGTETLASTSKTEWIDKTNNKYYVKRGDDWYVMDALPEAGFRLYSDSACTEEIPLIYDSTLGAYRKTTVSETGVEMKSATGTGIFNIKGLDVGTYYLKETTTPPGYNAVANITVTISATHKLATIEEAGANNGITANGPFVTLTENKTDNEIIDNRGNVLPSTGGVGTTLFYVFGSMLVLAAAVYFVTKKRSEVE